MQILLVLGRERKGRDRWSSQFSNQSISTIIPRDKGQSGGSLPGGAIREAALGLRSMGPSASDLTCGLDGHSHLIGAHAARLVQVKLPENGLSGE